ncbi:hypothetical protein RO3G_05594 [Rhizopus delemar RA 99-880]|uniref:Uncharacterized protein n=1 Tax=Rhizopus delemar (strain RA 99-880 / ATCC MYA-4621 / FGSC 9543 / NRRL 43880) TaxID=246409 RepID=I1BXF9_RHIO9|nr:hypothetical protein RO3G_05594 [Rhizopus delemar RA 99-880]|eukprot:EIE80889.1 hypothetical protein RO3G_05594 [Rhizopus delemar RA 99-880]
MSLSVYLWAMQYLDSLSANKSWNIELTSVFESCFPQVLFLNASRKCYQLESMNVLAVYSLSQTKN